MGTDVEALRGIDNRLIRILEKLDELEREDSEASRAKIKDVYYRTEESVEHALFNVQALHQVHGLTARSIEETRMQFVSKEELSINVLKLSLVGSVLRFLLSRLDFSAVREIIAYVHGRDNDTIYSILFENDARESKEDAEERRNIVLNGVMLFIENELSSTIDNHTEIQTKLDEVYMRLKDLLNNEPDSIFPTIKGIYEGNETTHDFLFNDNSES